MDSQQIETICSNREETTARTTTSVLCSAVYGKSLNENQLHITCFDVAHWHHAEILLIPVSISVLSMSINDTMEEFSVD